MCIRDSTNDGELTERMLHPSREVEKVYLARVSNQVTPEEARRLENGVMVDGRRTARAKVKLLSIKPLYTDMLVTIHEGRNRQVRKMVEPVSYTHLDVYKRQIRHCMTTSLGWRITRCTLLKKLWQWFSHFLREASGSLHRRTRTPSRMHFSITQRLSLIHILRKA